MPAGAPLPASNTWACRGAPPAPWTPAPHTNLQSRGDCDVIIEFFINFFCFRDQSQWFLKESPEMVE